jgi:hypothetical protein
MILRVAIKDGPIVDLRIDDRRVGIALSEIYRKHGNRTAFMRRVLVVDLHKSLPR